MKVKCNGCGKRFVPHKDGVYQAYDAKDFKLFGEPKKVYDAIDCPHCGCQILLWPRLPRLTDEAKELENLLA